MKDAFTEITPDTTSHDVANFAAQLSIIYAFADSQYKGGPAGVLIVDDDPAPSIMAGLALYSNMPVIVTLKPQGDNSYAIRWFTKNTELGLCGHATMAASYALFNGKEQGCHQLWFQKHDDNYITSYLNNGLITMEFPRLDTVSVDDETYKNVQDIVGVELVEVRRAYDDILAVFKHAGDVVSYQPQLNAIATLDCRGLIITAETSSQPEKCEKAKKPADMLSSYDIVSRFFAPNIGINEDQLCVSAHCKLQPYWREKLNITRPIKAFQASHNGGVLQLDGDKEHVTITGSALYGRH